MEGFKGRRFGPRIESCVHSQPTPEPTDFDAIFGYLQVRDFKNSLQKITFSIQPHPNVAALDSQTNSIPVSSPKGINQRKKTCTLQIPKITPIEIFVELGCLTILCYTLTFFLIKFSQMPDYVFMNFEPDKSVNSISKNYFLSLVVGDIFVYMLMTFLQLIPHKFKYLVEVTPENSLQVFYTTRLFILWYKLVTLSLILYICETLTNIIEGSWDARTMYLAALASVPYIFGGYIYQKRLIRIMINPYA